MIRRLRSVWDAPSATPPPPRRVWRDWALVSLLPVLAVIETLLRADVPNRVWALVVLVAAVPTLLWRRTQPLLMLAIAYGLTALFRVGTGHDIQLFTTAYLLLLVYSIFRWGRGRALVLGLALAVASTLGTFLFDGLDLADLIGGFVVLLLTASFGLLFRLRAASRTRELEQVKSREREELARDLHDTVAHHVSAIAIQAQAGLATAAKNPGAANAALQVIEAEASRTLTEMRTMVRGLRRDDPAQLAPAPTVADLRRLAEVDGGPVVDVQLSGDFGALPGPVAAGMYRMAQESVTNARRHARGASRIEVRVAVDDALVSLSVRDDGTAGAASGTPGYGITGMSERAALLGGTCTAGRAPEGGWLVTAVLPRTGAAA